MTVNHFTLSRRQCLLAIACLPLLPGCEQSPEKPLTIASHVWPGYELMFLARREGWLPMRGVLLRETTSATDSLAALAAGEVEGAALTLDEVLRARDRGIALTVVLVFDISVGADAVMVRPEIGSLAELAGKRIGVEQTALGALVLHKLLVRAGLSPSAITPVALDQNGPLAAWHQQRLDAVITYEPHITHLEEQGARRLFDSRDIPNTIFDVLAVRSDVAATYRHELSALVQAHFKAHRHLINSPQDAAYRMAGRMGLDAREVLAAYRGLELPDARVNRSLLSEGHLVEAARMLSRVMVEAGLLLKPAEIMHFSTPDYLPGEA